ERQLPAHEHHERKTEKKEKERREHVLQADHLVVEGEDIGSPKTVAFAGHWVGLILSPALVLSATSQNPPASSRTRPRASGSGRARRAARSRLHTGRLATA